MKKPLVCRWCMLLLIVSWLGNTLSAKEFKKNIDKSYSIAANGTVGLSNQYGTIDVQTWTKNQVKIEVTITVNARNQADANFVFEKIDIDFSKYDNYVKAITTIRKSNNSWGWSSAKMDYGIDYKVYIPQSCNLELANKYGDSFVASLNGTASLSAQYGNIRLADMNDYLKINLKHGNCRVIKSGNSEINLQHANISLQEAKNIEFLTSYSKINVGKALDIKSNSISDIYTLGKVREFRNQGRYDHISVEEVENIIVISKYSDFKIGFLLKRADFDMGYGSVEVTNVSKNFSEILMIGKYTDFKIEVEKGTPYKLDASALHAGLLFPEILNIIIEKDTNTEHSVEAYSGSNQNPNAYIKCRVNHGGLKVK